jgi:peptidoglycan/xylan/chitin deacetylase (PgdA/CDA1 family)
MEVSGVNSYIMRTPYGSAPNMTDAYKKAVKEKGYIMWDWNIDSKDWYYKDGRYVNNAINQIEKMKHHNGPLVILLHERKETLAHLPKLLDYLKKHGFEGKPIANTTTPVQF